MWTDCHCFGKICISSKADELCDIEGTTCKSTGSIEAQVLGHLSRIVIPERLAC